MNLLELSARRLGGSVVAASDEAFGEKEALLHEAVADFTPGTYGPRGEIVDGWETRRRRPGRGTSHVGDADWALVRLGVPGQVRSVDIDTSFFTGNFPTTARVEGCCVEGYPDVDALGAAGWVELVASSSLQGDAHNRFAVVGPAAELRCTHVRLWAEPDGGIARLRIVGEPVLDPAHFFGGIDLVSERYGSAVIASSDSFYTPPSVLIRPDSPRTMGEGWETRRRRDDGNDWVVIELGAAGVPERVEIDTTHFKYNASGEFALWSCLCDVVPDPLAGPWEPLLPRAPLQPDTRHVFAVPQAVPATHLRLDAFPDGGIARLHVHGQVSPAAIEAAELRWRATSPDRTA